MLAKIVIQRLGRCHSDKTDDLMGVVGKTADISTFAGARWTNIGISYVFQVRSKRARQRQLDPCMPFGYRFVEEPGRRPASKNMQIQIQSYQALPWR